MPVYEYLCTKCGKTTERFSKISERPGKIECNACFGLAKLMPSLSSFHLKGKGWAADGYDKCKDGKCGA